MTARTITLALLLFTFWLLLSGHYTPFLICSGAVASLLVVWVTKRKQNLDEESVPLEAFLGAVTYFPWLIYEIWKASLGVAKIVLQPKLVISPVMHAMVSKLIAGEQQAFDVAPFKRAHVELLCELLDPAQRLGDPGEEAASSEAGRA